MTFIHESTNVVAQSIADLTERKQLLSLLFEITGIERPKASTDQVMALLEKYELSEDCVYTAILDESDVSPLEINELSYIELLLRFIDECEPVAVSEKTNRPKRQVKRNGKSYQDMIREYFDWNDSIALDELAIRLGADIRNTQVAVSIVRNPRRTEDPLNIQYNRATKVFTIVR